MEKILDTISYYIEKNNYLAFALTYLITGILIIVFNRELFSSFVEIVLLIMLVSCIKDLFTILTNKKQSKLSFTKAIVSTILVLISLFFIDIPKALLIMIFATYFIFNGLIKFVSCYLIKRSCSSGVFKELLEGIISFSFGIICFFSPKIHMNIMLYIIGGYLLLLGVDYFFDFLEQKNIHMIKKFHFPLPPFIDALIPFSILQKINRLGENKNIEFDFHKQEENVDLEIFVHVSMKGTGRLGHVDLCFDGHIISYGNYDMNTRKLRDGIGSGVVFTCPKNKYIKFCVEYSEKTLFCFGIQLNEKQKEQVKQELIRIFDSLEEWKPNYVKALEDKENDLEKYDDYASMLYKNTKAKFYKFKSGRLKTFFILGNNCGSLVDKILRSSGADVLKMRGIITPGTYYDFLEREYLKKDSNVITKRIYNQGNIEKLK